MAAWCSWVLDVLGRFNGYLWKKGKKEGKEEGRKAFYIYLLYNINYIWVYVYVKKPSSTYRYKWVE